MNGFGAGGRAGKSTATGALVLAGFLLLTVPLPVDASSRAELPDLYITPADIAFTVYDEVIDGAEVGWPVKVTATVRNLGPGVSAAGNVSFYIDGKFLATVPVDGVLNASGPGSAGSGSIVWDTTGYSLGNHTVTAVAADAAGDANESNSNASVVFPLFKIPVLTLRLDTHLQEAPVTESASGVARFTGRVEVDFDPSQAIEVRLSSSVDTGWASSISPSLLRFEQAPGLGNFSVNVIVPQATPAVQIGTLKVNGRADTAGGITSPASVQALIRVKPYFRLMLECEKPHGEVNPGEVADFTIRAWNVGNAIDTLAVEVVNLEDLAGGNWQVMLSANQLSKVNPNEFKTLRLSVRAPSGGGEETRTVKLRVTSLNARDLGENATAEFSIQVKSKGSSFPAMMGIGLAAVIAVVVLISVVMLLRRARRSRSSEMDLSRPPRGPSAR